MSNYGAGCDRNGKRNRKKEKRRKKMLEKVKAVIEEKLNADGV